MNHAMTSARAITQGWRACWLCAAFLALAAVACSACLAAAAVEENLVRNPGFETRGQNGLPAEWNGPAAVYCRDEAVKRSGAASLKFVNPDASRYVLRTQRLPLKPGRRYELSAWIKTENISGTGSGATIALEWADDSVYLGHVVRAGFKGTTDWQQLKCGSGCVPDKATRCQVTIFVDRGMTGTAWWDDVSVVRVPEPPLSSVLRVPNYRGLVTDRVTEAQVRACLNLADLEEHPLSALELRWSLRKDGEEQAVRTGKAAATAATVDLRIPVSGLTAGEHELTVNLVALKTGQTLGATRHRLVRPAPGQVPKAPIDEHQRLLVDGKPFFPLGMYLCWSEISQADLADYMDSGIFNCLVGPPQNMVGDEARSYLDMVHAKGLKVIYPIANTYAAEHGCVKEIQTEADERPFVEKTVIASRDHPALLAWYVNDERPPYVLPRQVAHQRWVEELDPTHPTYSVMAVPKDVRRNLETYDIIGTDPYPVRPDNGVLSMVSDWTRQTVQGVAASRPVWMVSQVFNYNFWKKHYKHDPRWSKGNIRPPTFEEMRCMAWQCITEGATGLIFYGFFEMKYDKEFPFAQQWPKVKKMAEEIRDMTPVLLSVESPPAIEVKQAGWLHSLVKELSGTTYLILVNHEAQEHQAYLRFPRRPSRLQLRGGSEQTAEVGQDGVFSPMVEALGVRIYEVKF